MSFKIAQTEKANIFIRKSKSVHKYHMMLIHQSYDQRKLKLFKSGFSPATLQALHGLLKLLSEIALKSMVR